MEEDPEVVHTMENPLYVRSSIFSGGGGVFSRDSISSDDPSAPRAVEASAASRNVRSIPVCHDQLQSCHVVT